MAEGKFGKLENVALREGWPDEAADFTPWLAENLDRLSDAIGVPLELVDQEVGVEAFRADILAHSSEDDRLVLIENQLEASNHTHLGQILTYLTGLDAKIVVWIAREFREPHLSAVQWLNEHVGEPFAFFAVKVSLVRIADSPLVPIFDVLAKPSEWDRQLRRTASGHLSERGQFRRAFWAFYAERYPQDVEAAGIGPGHASPNVYYGSALQGVRVAQYLAVSEVGVYYTTLHGEPSELRTQRLAPYAEAMKRDLGIESWPGSILPVDTRDAANWESMADWLHDRLHAFLRVVETPL